MPRYRHKKKNNGPQTALPSTDSVKTTPTPLSNWVRSGITEEEFIQLMIGSADLADEPEFADLELDADKTAKVTDRWTKRYSRRLDAAEKKGPEAFSEVFDALRIEAIDELFTPSLRVDITRRLQQLIERLTFSRNKDKLEQAVLIQAALAEKKLPWGIVGLIVAIYDRALERTFKQIEEEATFSRSLLEALEEEKIDIDHLIDDPVKLEQVAEEISSTRPEILEQANEFLDQMADAFYEELFHGRVVLDLFTQEELVLPFQRLKADGGLPISEQKPSKDTSEQVGRAIETALIYIMTPERYQQFLKDLEKTGKTWFRKRHRWAAALDFEIQTMDPNEFEANPFVYAAYVGQMKRLSG